ncbi:MAG: hypothetical protein HZB16_18175 [Armatimonadetes bacterium]|nr:hypothetical protein [Armatimonadota bacterium]
MHRVISSGRLAALITLWLAGGAVAATFTTVQAGTWESAATWGGAVPGATDDAVIGHAVEVWSTDPIRNAQVNNGGSLTLMGAGADLQYSGDITTTGTGALNLAGDPGATLTVAGSGVRNLPPTNAFSRIVVNPGCSVVRSTDMTCSGMDIYGSFSQQTGTVTQSATDQFFVRDGATAQVVGSLHNLTIDTLASLTLLGPLTVSGAWTDASTGGFVSNGFAVTITGGGTAAYTGATTFADLTIDGTVLAVQTASTLGYTGALTAANGGQLDFYSNLPSTLAPSGGGTRALPPAAMLVQGYVGSIAGGTSTALTGVGDYTLRGSLSYDGDVTLTGGTLTVIGPSSLVGAGALNVAGLTVSSGAVDCSFVPLTATGTLTVAGGSFTGDGTVGAVSIAAGATLTLVDDLTVVGDFANAGTFAAGGNRVTFSGSPSVLTGSTGFDALTVTNRLNLAASTILTLRGSATASGTLDATATGADLAFATATVHVLPSTTLLNGLLVPAGQEVDSGTAMTVNGPALVAGVLDSSATTLVVTGSLRVQSTGTFRGHGTLGSVSLASGATVAQTGDWSVGGNFDNAGAIFSHNDHLMTFTGTADVTGATAFGGVTVGPSASITVAGPLTVSGPVTVAGALNTNAGGLQFVGTGDQAFTAAAPLTLGSLLVGPNSRVIQAANSAAITVTGAFTNNGRISRTLPVTATGLLDFGLTQAKVTVVTRGTLTQLQSVLVAGDHPNRAVHINGGQYWQFNETGAGYTVSIDLPTASATPGQVQICRYTGVGQQWESHNATVASGRAVATGVTGFSEWALSDAGEVTDATRTTTTLAGATFAGARTDVAVQLYQSDGTLRTTGGAALAGAVSGANTATLTVVDNANGTYRLSYTPTNLGDDSVAVTLGGSAVPGSPFTTTVGVGTPAAGTSTATVPAGVAGAVTTIAVQLKDIAGHNQLVGGATVAVAVTGANTATATVTDNADGTYTATYTPTLAGNDAVAVSLGGVALRGSPFTSVVAAGAPSATTSTASATPTTLPADGESAAMVSVVVRDAQGNLVSGAGAAQVTIVPVPATGATVGTVSASGADGVCTASVTGTTAGAVVLTVNVGGTALANTLTLTFRPSTTLSLATGVHFIGLPQTPDDPTPAGVLGAGNWRLARYDAGGHANVELDRALASAPVAYNFVPGRGLWLKLSAPATLRTMGALVNDPSYTLPLGMGWNAVANPYNADVAWRLQDMIAKHNNAPVATMDLAAAWEVVHPYAWTYDSVNSRYTLVMPTFGTSTTVPRCAGMWVFSERDNAGLEIPRPAAGRAQRGTPAAPSARNWLVNLAATGADGAVSGAAVGVSATMSRALTILAPPAVSGEGSVTLAVVTNSGRAAGEVRPSDGAAQTWDLAVTSRAVQPVTLSWAGLLRELPRGVVLEMTDLQSGRVTLLNTRTGYTYAPERAGEERRLRLTARLGHVTRADITSLSASPTRGRAVGLSMTLSAPAEVTLLVKGLGGKLARTLSYGQQTAGTLALSWDGADESGRALPAGSYLLEATAVAANGAVSRAQRTVTLP